jgi:hypothetical protein
MPRKLKRTTAQQMVLLAAKSAPALTETQKQMLSMKLPTVVEMTTVGVAAK